MTFYNSYANRIGFSIRTDTSRLSGPEREQRKVLFVRNKEGHGRKENESVPTAESNDSALGPVKLGYSLNSLEGNALFLQDFRNEKKKLNYKN